MNNVLKFINQSRGFSLMETVVALGMLGIVSLGLMHVMKNSNEQTRRFELDLEKNQYFNHIVRTLSDKAVCESALKGRSEGAIQPPGLSYTVNGQSRTLLTVGQTVDGGRLQVSSINMSLAENRAVFEMELLRTADHVQGNRMIKREFSLPVITDGSAIQECFYSRTGAYDEELWKPVVIEVCEGPGFHVLEGSSRCEIRDFPAGTAANYGGLMKCGAGESVVEVQVSGANYERRCEKVFKKNCDTSMIEEVDANGNIQCRNVAGLAAGGTGDPVYENTECWLTTAGDGVKVHCECAPSCDTPTDMYCPDDPRPSNKCGGSCPQGTKNCDDTVIVDPPECGECSADASSACVGSQAFGTYENSDCGSCSVDGTKTGSECEDEPVCTSCQDPGEVCKDEPIYCQAPSELEGQQCSIGTKEPQKESDGSVMCSPDDPMLALNTCPNETVPGKDSCGNTCEASGVKEDCDVSCPLPPEGSLATYHTVKECPSGECAIPASGGLYGTDGAARPPRIRCPETCEEYETWKSWNAVGKVKYGGASGDVGAPDCAYNGWSDQYKGEGAYLIGSQSGSNPIIINVLDDQGSAYMESCSIPSGCGGGGSCNPPDCCPEKPVLCAIETGAICVESAAACNAKMGQL